VDEPRLVLSHVYRNELREVCELVGLRWKKELCFTTVHRAIRAGGICVEIEKV
jgi:hypothetical protein